MYLNLRGSMSKKTAFYSHGSVDFSLHGQWNFFFFFFWPPCGIWSSQAGDQVWVAGTTYNLAMPDPLTSCAGLGIVQCPGTTEMLLIPLCCSGNSRLVEILNDLKFVDMDHSPDSIDFQQIPESEKPSYLIFR